MANALSPLVRAAILARASEKRLNEKEMALKKLHERLPDIRKPGPAIPPPRVLPPIRRVQIPIREEIPVPKPSITSEPLPEQRTQEIGIPQGYTKIVLPQIEDDFETPVPEKLEKFQLEKFQEERREPIIQQPQRELRQVPRQMQPRQQPIRQIRQPASVGIPSNLNLGIIGDFINDPYVKAVDYEDGRLKVITADGEKEKGALSEDDAKSIIENFARAAGVEVKPAFEVIVGSFRMSAVMSEILGVKFSIEKI